MNYFYDLILRRYLPTKTISPLHTQDLFLDIHLTPTSSIMRPLQQVSIYLWEKRGMILE